MEPFNTKGAIDLVALARSKTATDHPLTLDKVSDTTKILERKRQMGEAQAILQKHHLEHVHKEKKLKKREEALRANDLKLMRDLISYDKFLRDNDLKREKATTKFHSEATIRKAKELELAELASVYEVLKKKKMRTAMLLERSLNWQKFLQGVCESSDQFSNIHDLRRRYDTLEVAKQEIIREANIKSDAKNLERRYQNNYKEQKTHEIICANNELAALQSKLEAHTQMNASLQAALDEIHNEYEQKNLDRSRALMTIENLYAQLPPARQIAHQIAPKTLTGASVKPPEVKAGDKHSSTRDKVEQVLLKLKLVEHWVADVQEFFRVDKFRAVHGAAGSSMRPRDVPAASQRVRVDDEGVRKSLDPDQVPNFPTMAARPMPNQGKDTEPDQAPQS